MFYKKNLHNNGYFVNLDREAEGPANKTDINLMIFILLFVRNCLSYNAVHDFSVWLKTRFNPADIDRFQSLTEKY